MNILDGLAGTPVSEALGWTLFHSLWQGVFIAAGLALLLASSRSPRIRYLAGCAALLAMLASFAGTLLHFLAENQSGAPAMFRTTLPTWRELAIVTSTEGGFPGFATLIPWLAPLWLVGVCLFYLRCAAGWLALYRLRHFGVCNAPARWQRTVARLAAELSLSRPVLLLESLFADTPVVLGHFRPVILAPIGFLAGLPPDQVEAILLHELAHISRADYFINVCQRLIEGMLFYHPAVWWISRVIRAERENCCDDKVVSLTGDAHRYAKALTALEHNRLRVQWPSSEPAVAATGGNLMKRIKRLLYPKGTAGIWAPALAAFVLMASTATLLAAWHSNPNPSPAFHQTGNTMENSWQKWLNEEVVYIISDEERAAFERLKTDEERQRFADQFWARRDPTPGTPENEFKREHYRRIAYANDHFRTASGKPGWQTDRGHMYILYGPPDEIDAHPSGTAKISRPYQSWGYRHVDGLGDNLFLTFVDQTGAGDYRLAPGTRR